ncbi:MAG: response regulator transcription factor [Anaerolineaceae bacterium]|nr:MAG: response regulator transcription factor [Anaerolineaceae bacterium]
MDQLIRVLVVDDHTVVRKGLCSLLTSKYGIEVIGEAADGLDAVNKARDLQPDVILMDMVMPGMDGLVAIQEIKKEDPDARILILSSFSEDVQIVAAIRAGALGYVLKDSSPDELVHTIHSAYLGKLSLSEDMFQLVLSKPEHVSSEIDLDAALTEREIDVLRELARGSSNPEIAETLSVSVTTVRSHISSILGKLALENRTQAAIYANKAGLLTAEE